MPNTSLPNKCFHIHPTACHTPPANDPPGTLPAPVGNTPYVVAAGAHRGCDCGCNHSSNNCNVAPPPNIAAPEIPAPAPTPTWAPNNNKWFKNHNYYFSCGYDMPLLHTNASCPDFKCNHQAGCTCKNIAQYEALGHLSSRKAIHNAIMPINPGPYQA